MPPDQPTNKPLKILKSRKRRSALVIAIVLTLVLGLGYFLYQGDIIRIGTGDLPCTDNPALLNRTSGHINPQTDDSYEELRQISSEIEQLENYDNDINCLYVLASFYILEFQLPAAEETLATIKSLQTDGQVIADVLGGSIESLEQRLATQQRIEQEIDNNSLVIPDTEAIDEGEAE